MPLTLPLPPFQQTSKSQEFSQLKFFAPRNAFFFSHHILSSSLRRTVHLSKVNMLVLSPFSISSIKRGSLPFDNLGDFYPLKQKQCRPSLGLTMTRQRTLLYPPFHQCLLTKLKYLLPMTWLPSQWLFESKDLANCSIHSLFLALILLQRDR